MLIIRRAFWHAIVDVENCENWQWFLSIVLKDLGAPRLIISDKLSGLHAINEWLRGIKKNEQVRKHYRYAEDLETVRMSVCAVHAARSCGITNRIALGGVIRMALCGDIGFRRRYLRSFVIGDSSRGNMDGKITQQQANKLAKRLPEFCFPEMGLDTCTGIVTSNQAESSNHETTKLRNLDVHEYTGGMLCGCKYHYMTYLVQFLSSLYPSLIYLEFYRTIWSLKVI